MEILLKKDNRIKLQTEKEEYSFINIGKQEECYWKLIEYKKCINEEEGLWLEIDGTLNKNTTYSTISLGYQKNHLIRRVLEFNEEGNLERDYIYFINPFNNQEIEEYDAVVLPNIPLNDYYLEERSLYRNKNTSFHNTILPDEMIKDFMKKDTCIGDYLNQKTQEIQKIDEILSEQSKKNKTYRK